MRQRTLPSRGQRVKLTGVGFDRQGKRGDRINGFSIDHLRKQWRKPARLWSLPRRSFSRTHSRVPALTAFHHCAGETETGDHLYGFMSGSQDAPAGLFPHSEVFPSRGERARKRNRQIIGVDQSRISRWRCLLRQGAFVKNRYSAGKTMTMARLHEKLILLANFAYPRTSVRKMSPSYRDPRASQPITENSSLGRLNDGGNAQQEDR